jgi:LmbE family N-acetylglucosaminyl deacetylase
MMKKPPSTSDHRVADQAALDAIYAAHKWTIFPEQLVCGVELWRVQEAYLFWADSADAWEDVTCCFEARIAALARHSSQVDGNFEEMVERIGQRACEAGEALACEYAEAFKRIRFR